MRLGSPEVQVQLIETGGNGTNGGTARTCKLSFMQIEPAFLTDPSLQYANFENDASKQKLSLDVDLLCAKLEAAKWEQDEAARRRRQKRRALRNSNCIPQNEANEVMWASTRMLQGIDRPRRSDSTEKAKTQPTRDVRRGADQQSIYAAINNWISENEAIRHAAVMSTPGLDCLDTDNRPHSRRSSIGDIGATRPKLVKDKSKRRSLANFLDLVTSPTEKSSQTPQKKSERPGDSASRRSETDPLVRRKPLPVSRGSWTTYERIEIPRHSIAQDEIVESPMGFVNEYTVSYDTCELREEYGRLSDCSLRSNRQSHDRPLWVERSRSDITGLRNRSLLNVPSMLKKDKTQAKCEEVLAELPALTESQGLSETLDYTARTRYRPAHVRQKSSPENMITDAVTKIKQEERAKKRQTILGFCQGIIMPHHSMSYHGVAI